MSSRTGLCGPHNIRINSPCWGPMQVRISPRPSECQWHCDITTLRRGAYPRGVAHAALFLASAGRRVFN